MQLYPTVGSANAWLILNEHFQKIRQSFWLHYCGRILEYLGMHESIVQCPFGKNRGAGLVYHLSSFTCCWRGKQTPLLINQPMGKGHLWFLSLTCQFWPTPKSPSRLPEAPYGTVPEDIRASSCVATLLLIGGFPSSQILSLVHVVHGCIQKRGILRNSHLILENHMDYR